MSGWKKFLTILVTVSAAITPGVSGVVDASPPLTLGVSNRVSNNYCPGERAVQAEARSITVKIPFHLRISSFQ